MTVLLPSNADNTWCTSRFMISMSLFVIIISIRDIGLIYTRHINLNTITVSYIA